MNEGGQCSADDCENDAASGGLCWGHIKKRGKGQGLGKLAKKPKSKLARLEEAALAYADAEGDDDFERAKDNLRKSAAAANPAVIAELTRAALAKLKRRGVKLGRPRKVDPADAVRILSEAGDIAEAAMRLQVSVKTVRRALRRAPATKRAFHGGT